MRVLIILYVFAITIFYPYGIMKIRVFDLINICTIFLICKSFIVRRSFTINKALLVIFPLMMGEAIINTLSISLNYYNILSLLRYSFIYLTPIILISLQKEKKDLKGVMVFLLSVNFLYSIIQLLAGSGIIDESFLFMRKLNVFLIESHNEQFRWTSRVNGLFINSTQYSIFLSFCLYTFLGDLTKKRISLKELIIIIIIIISIILTQSRIGLILSLFNIGIYFFLSNKKKEISFIVIILGIVCNRYLGKYLFRILRLFKEGLNDYSAGVRILKWENVIKGLKNYPYGTLENPVKIFGTIDSGYLSYYAQGKYFLFTLLILFIGSMLIIAIKKKEYSLFFFSNYIFLSMIFLNPMHNFFAVFVMVYLLDRVPNFKNKEENERCLKLPT